MHTHSEVQADFLCKKYTAIVIDEARAWLLTWPLHLPYPSIEAHERGVLPPNLDIRAVVLRFRFRCCGWGFGQVNCDILIGLLSRAVQQRRKAFEEA